MNQENPKNWKNGVEHPAEDELLFFIDGELPAKDSGDIKTHLEACWDCRNRAEKFQSAISLYVDYRATVLKPLITPPGSWSGFDSKLRQQAAELVPPTFWQSFQGMIQRFRITLPRIEQRLATISLATVLLGAIGLYVLFTGANTTVSAEELISRSVASREAELKKADQPVLYQHLRVTRRNADKEEAANVEVWQDVENLRIRKIVTPINEEGPESILTDLEQVLKASKYDPPPLSIVGFRGWRNALASRKDSVEELTAEDGVPALRLETQASGKIDPNRLVASVLTLRSSDYHPLEQVFRVLTDEGVQEYEVRESSFAVMSLNSLNPGFFADSQPMIVSARPEPKPSASITETANANTANTNTEVAAPAAANTVATAELEVDITNALHNAGADLGEQIEVRRTPNGPLTIVGVVETPERKAQILNALGALKDNPAVRVQISTVSEALAAEKSNKARPQPSIERVELETDNYPAEGDLLAHFKDAVAARTFAARMTAQSLRAMNYLWAMRRLKGQFSASQIEKLTPEARAKLLGVVRSYAASYQREVGNLRRELQPVFGGGVGGGASRIGSDAELIQVMDQLFSAGSSVNRVVRTAFTTGSTATNALRAPQFWQTLSRAESLAVSIERYK